MSGRPEQPPSIHLPQEFADRETAYSNILRARLELDILIAERNINRHEYTKTQSTVLDQVREVEAQLDAVNDAADLGAVPHPNTLELLNEALVDLERVRQDTDGDFEQEDARFAEKIDKLEASIAAWCSGLN